MVFSVISLPGRLFRWWAWPNFYGFTIDGVEKEAVLVHTLFAKLYLGASILLYLKIVNRHVLFYS